MTLRTRSQATQSFLFWSQSILIGIGVLTLSYCAFTLTEAQVFQMYERWRFRTSLSDQSLPEIARAMTPSLPPAGGLWGTSPLGRLTIPSVGIDTMILEGTDPSTLRRAIGHIPGTALPGQPGNVAIAGHRDTFFRALRNLHNDDDIELTTFGGLYHYRVDSTKVVEPSDVQVLRDSDGFVLTLVTCYPFQFLGEAPKRFVVRAHRTVEARVQSR